MTKYGDIPASKRVETHADGTMQSCTPIRKCILKTSLGDFVPQYTTDDLRKKEVLPVVFYKSGLLRTLPLEQQTMVSTPAGETPAELITFHPNGNVNRVFPLNGKLSGYWSQEDEADMAKLMTLHTPVGTIKTKAIGVGFHENKALRSITFWPDEAVTILTPIGSIEARIGISFATNGTIQSLEPAKPTPVKTMVGEITAYDPDAVGINGDTNSLVLDEQGEVKRVATTLTRLTVIDPDGKTSTFTPQYRESLCGDTEQEIVPMIISFGDVSISIQLDQDAPGTCFPRSGHLFSTTPYLPQLFQPIGIMRCSI